MADTDHTGLRGRRTHEQRQRIINRQEETKGVDVDPHSDSIGEARRKRAASPPAAYDNSTGDRTIKRGRHQETRHNKDRADDE